MISLTFSTALATMSGDVPVIYACKGSSSPGNGPNLTRPNLPSLIEPLPKFKRKSERKHPPYLDEPRMMIFALVYKEKHDKKSFLFLVIKIDFYLFF